MQKQSRPRQTSHIRKNRSADRFMEGVRGFVPAARRLLVTGVTAEEGVECIIERLLKKRGQWTGIGDDQIRTVVASSREGFLLGVAYGTQLNLKGAR